MSSRPTVVYFYMIGCPHCEAMRPAMDQAKKMMKGVDIEEKESAQVEDADGVSSFPTVILKKKGKEVKRIEGSRPDGGTIVKELGLKRGGSNRGRTHRRGRSLRHRTLRNRKAFT
jgi:thiol-disulfide isomerase/thioredoxin